MASIPPVAESTASMGQPIYELSTQSKHWRYSIEKLAQIRASLTEAAVAAIRSTLEIDEPGSSSSVSFVNADEELLLVKLYITKITQLCGLFRFPEEVEATAVSYLKRFYLKNTVMDWHPKNVMLTALFLATKTTNNPISLETYTTHIPKTAPSDVLDLEFLVAQSLNFEFNVWHAHRALWGIWLDTQSLPDLSEKLSPEIYNQALNHVRASRMTDAELIYSPSQIAYAAFALIVPEVALQWAQSKLSVNDYSTSLSFTGLTDVADQIQSLIMNYGHPPDVESVRKVDRQLKLCKNPEKVVGSKRYLAKKVEEEKKAEERRNKKAMEATKAIEEGDPFGIALTERRPGLVDYDDEEDD